MHLQEEFDAIMLPKHNKGANNMGRHLLQHEPLSEAASVPNTVGGHWRRRNGD